jgi:hypothetical protein
MIDPETGEYIGQPFTTNTAVRISYLIPSGPSANGISTITYTSPLNGATLYVNTTSAGGRETLSTDSLRFFIPRSFAAQNRNVTQADIKASLIEANFALTEDQITLTTSADEPGKIYVSISGTTPDQDALLEFLNSRGIMGIVYQYGTV